MVLMGSWRWCTARAWHASQHDGWRAVLRERLGTCLPDGLSRGFTVSSELRVSTSGPRLRRQDVHLVANNAHRDFD
jgi:hypothetical protein